VKSMLISLVGAVLLVAAGTTLTLAQATPGATPEATPESAGGLPETVWQLTEAALADGTTHVPDDPALYTIQFLPDGLLSARADCNQVGGTYEVDGDALILSEMRTTLVGCPEGSLGGDYTAWLESVVGFELAEDALILSLEDGGTLRFEPMLLGVTWEWHEFLGGDDTVITPANPGDYTIRFQEDGSVLVQADCNRGSGSYTADESTIDIEQIALTRMACPDDSLGNDFAANLEEVSSYVYAGGQLALALPVDSGILLFRARAQTGTPDEATPAGG
jgi:heat shock protein HslJ